MRQRILADSVASCGPWHNPALPLNPAGVSFGIDEFLLVLFAIQMSFPETRFLETAV